MIEIAPYITLHDLSIHAEIIRNTVAANFANFDLLQPHERVIKPKNIGQENRLRTELTAFCLHSLHPRETPIVKNLRALLSSSLRCSLCDFSHQRLPEISTMSLGNNLDDDSIPLADDDPQGEWRKERTSGFLYLIPICPFQ